jgi:hypothetical protein
MAIGDSCLVGKRHIQSLYSIQEQTLDDSFEGSGGRLMMRDDLDEHAIEIMRPWQRSGWLYLMWRWT